MIQAATYSSYDPNKLLNIVNARLGVSSDGALSKKLKVARKLIGDIRARRVQVGGSLLMLMHEATGISIEELRRLMGDRRARCRLSVPVLTPRGAATN
ncbi:hypothetical protein [Noviherbaspirillum sp. ST9]|uniref:hypothetical protein n=1 Tax=Noviherbaspirillum sp. ST9 TaxID=3401606 RepID=UPI003B5872E6